MTDFLNDKQLKGPLGTRRQPQFSDLVPNVLLQDVPLVKLPEEKPRWETSIFTWQVLDMDADLAETQDRMANALQTQQTIRHMARRFDVQAALIEEVLRRHDGMVVDMAARQGRDRGKGMWKGMGRGAGKGMGKGGQAQNANAAGFFTQVLERLRPLARGRAAAEEALAQGAARRPHFMPPELQRPAFLPDNLEDFQARRARSGASTQASGWATPFEPTPRPRSPSVDTRAPITPVPWTEMAEYLDLPEHFSMATPLGTPRPVEQVMQMSQELARQQQAQRLDEMAQQAAGHVGTAIDLMDTATRGQLIGAAAASAVGPSQNELLNRVAAAAVQQSVAPHPALEGLRQHYEDIETEIRRNYGELQDLLSAAQRGQAVPTDFQDRTQGLQQRIARLTREMEETAALISGHLNSMTSAAPSLERQLLEQTALNAAIQEVQMAFSSDPTQLSPLEQGAHLQHEPAGAEPHVMGLPSAVPGPPQPPAMAPAALGQNPDDFAENWPPNEGWNFNPTNVDPLRLAFDLFYQQLDANERRNLHELARTHRGELFRVMASALTQRTKWDDDVLENPYGKLAARRALTEALHSAARSDNGPTRTALIKDIALYLRAMELERQRLLRGQAVPSTLPQRPIQPDWAAINREARMDMVQAGWDAVRQGTPMLGRAAMGAASGLAQGTLDVARGAIGAGGRLIEDLNAARTFVESLGPDDDMYTPIYPPPGRPIQPRW